jgi:hypothetical protein
MQEKQLVQRCRECGKVRVSRSWQRVVGHEADWILVDAYCPSCFMDVLTSVVHVHTSANRLGVTPAAGASAVYGGPQVV